MALKAGTVGIDPKYVDNNGKPVSDVDLSNYYTKSETDGKLDLKANKSYLTANNKIFNFAYDAESGKYGYKAGAQDDFHPFESAGGPGWVAPASLINTGITYPNSRAEYVSGGYYVDTDTNICYVDMIVKVISTSAVSIKMPEALIAVGITTMSERWSATAEDAASYIDNRGNASKNINGVQITLGTHSDTDTYSHVWGAYQILTT